MAIQLSKEDHLQAKFRVLSREMIALYEKTHLWVDSLYMQFSEVSLSEIAKIQSTLKSSWDINKKLKKAKKFMVSAFAAIWYKKAAKSLQNPVFWDRVLESLKKADAGLKKSLEDHFKKAKKEFSSEEKINGNSFMHYSSEALNEAAKTLDTLKDYLAAAKEEVMQLKNQISEKLYHKLIANIADEQQIQKNRQKALVSAILLRLQQASRKNDLTYDDVIFPTIELMNQEGIFNPPVELPKSPRRTLNQKRFFFFHTYVMTYGSENQKNSLNGLNWMVPYNIRRFDEKDEPIFRIKWLKEWHWPVLSSCLPYIKVANFLEQINFFDQKKCLKLAQDVSYRAMQINAVFCEIHFCAEDELVNPKDIFSHPYYQMLLKSEGLLKESQKKIHRSKENLWLWLYPKSHEILERYDFLLTHYCVNQIVFLKILFAKRILQALEKRPVDSPINPKVIEFFNSLAKIVPTSHVSETFKSDFEDMQKMLTEKLHLRNKAEEGRRIRMQAENSLSDLIEGKITFIENIQPILILYRISTLEENLPNTLESSRCYQKLFLQASEVAIARLSELTGFLSYSLKNCIQVELFLDIFKNAYLFNSEKKDAHEKIKLHSILNQFLEAYVKAISSEMMLVNRNRTDFNQQHSRIMQLIDEIGTESQKNDFKNLTIGDCSIKNETTINTTICFI